MKQNATRKLFQYWRSLKTDENLPPERNSFKPGMFTDLIPYLFIVENSLSSMNGILRLAGGGLSNLYGRELTGMNFFNLWQISDQHMIDEMFADLRTASEAVVVTAAIDWRDGHQITSEFIFLPFLHSEGRKIIGMQTLYDKELSKKLATQFGQHSLSPAAEVNKVLDKGRAHIEPVFGIADVFTAQTEMNIIEFSRRGRAPADAKKVGHLSVIEGGAS
jgi:hypothetical protein